MGSMPTALRALLIALANRAFTKPVTPLFSKAFAKSMGTTDAISANRTTSASPSSYSTPFHTVSSRPRWAMISGIVKHCCSASSETSAIAKGSTCPVSSAPCPACAYSHSAPTEHDRPQQTERLLQFGTQPADSQTSPPKRSRPSRAAQVGPQSDHRPRQSRPSRGPPIRLGVLT